LSPTLARDAAAGFSRHLGLERKLGRELSGEVRFDAFTRGRYAADASIYQIMPAGVVFPNDLADLEAVLRIAREEGVSVIARGAGTSQNGQPIGAGLVVDFSRSLNAITSYDPEERVVTVEPGIVLERLNARLKRDGLFFPVEPSTATRCTIGGMTGNNSCGTRSIRYGIMRDNVLAIDAILADGTEARFGEVGHNRGLPLPALSPQAGRGDPANPSAACAPSTGRWACSCGRWPTCSRTAPTACARPARMRCSTPTTSAPRSPT